MSHLTRLPEGIPQVQFESSVVLSTSVQQECTSYDGNISKLMGFLNGGHIERVSKIYSDIVGTCTKFGCRNHLRDLHLQVSDYFGNKNQPIHRLAAYTLGYYFSQAATNSPEALGIEQNEYAISSREPIGTASVGECICICLKNLTSSEIFVAHVDRRTSMESINQAIKDFLKDSKAEGYLIGGSVEDENLLEISKENLSKIKAILSSYGEKIKIEEKTLETPHSTAFVYECNGNLRENVYPGKLSIERMARNGIAAKAGMRPISKFESRSSSPLTPFEISREEAEFAKEQIACLENEQHTRTSPVHHLELESVVLYADNRLESPKKISAIDQLLQGDLFSKELMSLTFDYKKNNPNFAALELLWKHTDAGKIEEHFQSCISYLQGLPDSDKKTLALKALFETKVHPNDFPPLLDEERFSCNGFYLTGKELIGRLWGFISGCEQNNQDECKEGMLTALSKSFEQGSLVCNQGKTQRLLIAVLQGRLEGVQIDDLAPVLSPDQALDLFFEDKRRQGIENREELLAEANRFLDDNRIVQRESFMAKLEEYWKFREPEQEEAVQEE